MFPRTLVIGLGGTGELALLALKDLFRTYAENSPEGRRSGSSPSSDPPSNVRLLYVDTVAPQGGRRVSLTEAECVRLAVRDPQELLKDSSKGHLHTWFPDTKLVSQTLIHGAGQIRPLGRLSLHALLDQFTGSLGKQLDELTDRRRLREADPLRDRADDGTGGESAATRTTDDHGAMEVYIMASLCGGTGSALFLDVAALVRDELKNAPTVRVIGVLLLPGPFRRQPATTRVLPNAYASLKELEYLGTLGPNAEVELDFGSRKVALRRSPFDLVYLVDSVGERYDTTIDLTDLARQMAYLPFLMSSSEMGTSVREVLHNLIPQLESRALSHGKRAAYASFGVSTLETPASVIREARYAFQVKLFESLLVASEHRRSFVDIEKECRERLSPPTLHTPPRLNAGVHDLQKISGDNLLAMSERTLEAAEEYARLEATKALATASAPLREQIRRLGIDAANQLGLLKPTIADCATLARVLASLRDAVPDEKSDREASDKIESERPTHWERCYKAFKAFRRGGRGRAYLEWQVWLHDRPRATRMNGAVHRAHRNALGQLIDDVARVERRCIAIVNAFEEAKARFEESQKRQHEETTTTGEAATPFSRNFAATSVEPKADAGAFLRQLDLARLLPEDGEQDLDTPQVVSHLVAQSDGYADTVFVDALRSVGSLSAARLFVKEARPMLDELRRFSAPLWSYSPTQALDADHIEILGTDQPDQVRAKLGGGVKVALTSWWDRVVHLQIRAGVPLFALTCMSDLWRSYCKPEDRTAFHIDKRWTLWPELLAHDFAHLVAGAFAQGLAYGFIPVTVSDPQFVDGGRPRELGRHYVDAFNTLSHDRALLEAIRKEVGRAHSSVQDVARRRDELRNLFVSERLSIEDRPLVEALCRRLDRLVVEFEQASGV